MIETDDSTHTITYITKNGEILYKFITLSKHYDEDNQPKPVKRYIEIDEESDLEYEELEGEPATLIDFLPLLAAFGLLILVLSL